MKKRIGRRLVSLLLTVVTILTMLPAMTLPALAATGGKVTGLTDTDIGLSFNGKAEDPWTATGAQIIGRVEGATDWSETDYSDNSTLTITNNKSTKATLSFDYTIEKTSGGTIQVKGTPVTAGNSFSVELERGSSITVYIDSGEGEEQYAKITMSNVKLVADATATVTFQPAVNGNYTVDGKLITEAWTDTRSSEEAYQVAATPADGYLFLGWYNETEGKFISIAPNTALNIEKGCVVTARFASKTAALFETNGQRFDDLNEAIAAAQKQQPATIKLIADGTITEKYAIPSGVTLLIPFDEAGTLYRETPTATKSTTAAKAFRTLTMAAGSSITLENGAALSVGGQYYAPHGGSKGQMVGLYGCIKMGSGSAITVKNGANLYAWGFISGSGSVTVEKGGSVYEWYQILDFRGGAATSQILHRVFPFSQYAVQNIEVSMTLYAGANETVYTVIDAADTLNATSISFIGDNGLFKPVSGSLTKAYDGSTDRIIYTIDGTAELNSMSLSLGGTNVNSGDYELPLTNNMTVNLNSGGKLTVNQSVALLPGVEVSIAKGAELVISKDKRMYVYDLDQWDGYCGNNNVQFIPVPYTSCPRQNRQPLADVKIDINGTLRVTSEKKWVYENARNEYFDILTTKSGANICSSEGSGRYVQHGTASSDSNTYQYKYTGGKVFKVKKFEIPVTAAKLKNANGSYTQTAGAKANDTFTYCTCPDCGGKWTKNLQVAAIINNGTQGDTYSTLEAAVKAYSPDNNTAPTNYIKLLHNTTEDIKNITKDIYLDLNGRTVTGDISVTGAYKLYGMDSSAKADYTTAPKGKIVGTVTGCAPTYQTPGDTNDRYVAISVTENGTSNLSFHRFNISVSGYRFELKAPECALFFIGKFQGDKAAKDYLTSLGFTLTDKNGNQLGEDSYEFTADTVIPDESNPGTSPVVRSGDAFLFEVYLKRSFNKENRNGYTEKIFATAQATFKNNVGTQDSEPKQWSFEDAWTNVEGLDHTQQEILDKFLKDLGITKQAE